MNNNELLGHVQKVVDSLPDMAIAERVLIVKAALGVLEARAVQEAMALLLNETIKSLFRR